PRPRTGRGRSGAVRRKRPPARLHQAHGDHQTARSKGVGSEEWGVATENLHSPFPIPHSHSSTTMARKFIIKSDAPRASLINYREALNEEQRAVAGAGAGPILVIAGAGSGKTRTVTYRVARLIEAGVAPGRIMLVTFTNRAAREMLGRVESLLG